MNALKTFIIIIVLLILTIISFFVVYKVTPTSENITANITLPIEGDALDIDIKRTIKTPAAELTSPSSETPNNALNDNSSDDTPSANVSKE